MPNLLYCRKPKTGQIQDRTNSRQDKPKTGQLPNTGTNLEKGQIQERTNLMVQTHDRDKPKTGTNHRQEENHEDQSQDI